MTRSPRTRKGIDASPRLARILADLREDPSSRQELEDRVNNERRGAAKRQAPLTAQQQLLLELHRQAAAEELPAQEAPAPTPALVPEWGADDGRPEEAHPPAAPRPRPSPRPRPAPPLPNTPWAAEVVARARGHYTTEPEEFAAGGRGRATVRARQKGLELFGQYHFGSQTQTERIAASVTAAGEPHEPYQPQELEPCARIERPGVNAARWKGGNLDLGPHAQKSPFGDAALLQGFRSPFIDAAQREAAALRQRSRDREMAPKPVLSARAARAKPLLSPRRPLKAAGRPTVLPSLDDPVDGLDEHEMVTARLMLAGGLRR